MSGCGSFQVQKGNNKLDQANTIRAVINIIRTGIFELPSRGWDVEGVNNRANRQGASLEAYVKDMYAGTLGWSEEDQIREVYTQQFSWLGSANNPPDLIIRGGDAIEVKKHESMAGTIQLNSSYPLQVLEYTNSRLPLGVRSAEEFIVKDLLYVIGQTKQNRVRSLTLVYGTDYAAPKQQYELAFNTIRSGIQQIPGITLSDTNELARLNRVDDAASTDFRIRGMWQIKHPLTVFDHVITDRPQQYDFWLLAIINEAKYQLHPAADIAELESIANQTDSGLTVESIMIPSPSDLSALVPAKLISYVVR